MNTDLELQAGRQILNPLFCNKSWTSVTYKSEGWFSILCQLCPVLEKTWAHTGQITYPSPE